VKQEEEEESSELASAPEVDSATYSDSVSGVWSLKDEEEAAAQTGTQIVEGKRIAVKQLDWDSINATDLLALFRSFCLKSPKMAV